MLGLPSSRRCRVTDWLLSLRPSASNARPRAIGLDVLLDRPSPPGHALEDDALEDALKMAKARGVPVILACDPLPGRGGPAFPLPRFRRWAALGHVNVPVGGGERDSRRRSGGKSAGVRPVPAFAAALAARAANVPEAGTNAWLAKRLGQRGRYAPFIYYMPGVDLPALPMNSITPQFPDRLHGLDGKVISDWGDGGRDRRLPPDAAAQPAFRRELAGSRHTGGHGGDPAVAGVSERRGRRANGCCPRSFPASSLLCSTGSARAGAWPSALGLLPLAAFGSLCLFAFAGWLVNLVPCLLAVLVCALGWARPARPGIWQRCFDAFLTRPVHRGIGSLNNLRRPGRRDRHGQRHVLRFSGFQPGLPGADAGTGFGAVQLLFDAAGRYHG